MKFFKQVNSFFSRLWYSITLTQMSLKYESSTKDLNMWSTHHMPSETKPRINGNMRLNFLFKYDFFVWLGSKPLIKQFSSPLVPETFTMKKYCELVYPLHRSFVLTYVPLRIHGINKNKSQIFLLSFIRILFRSISHFV
jgi:hypothetical protein